MKKKTAKIAKMNSARIRSFFNMGAYFNTKMLIIPIFMLGLGLGVFFGLSFSDKKNQETLGINTENKYWFLLLRASNIEHLMQGVPGEISKSHIVKTFKVKAGVPGQKPTPLPELLGKKYWVITKKFDSSENLETAPYFIELNVPAPEVPPYGPAPYLECPPRLGEAGLGQCDWELPGPFGLHGINGDLSRLSEDNVGSSGCIRHSDEDITYLYNLLDPTNMEIRYYIKDI